MAVYPSLPADYILCIHGEGEEKAECLIFTVHKVPVEKNSGELEF